MCQAAVAVRLLIMEVLEEGSSGDKDGPEPWNVTSEATLADACFRNTFHRRKCSNSIENLNFRVDGRTFCPFIAEWPDPTPSPSPSPASNAINVFRNASKALDP